MKRTHIIQLALGISVGFIGSACTKANLGVPPVPEPALVEKNGIDSRPLFLIDSVVVSDNDLHKLSPNDIKHVDVLKPNATNGNDLVSRYGPKAKYGVILVTTKKGK